MDKNITKYSDTEIVITTIEKKEEIYSKDLILSRIASCDSLIKETEVNKQTWVDLLKKTDELDVMTVIELDNLKQPKTYTPED